MIAIKTRVPLFVFSLALSRGGLLQQENTRSCPLISKNNIAEIGQTGLSFSKQCAAPPESTRSPPKITMALNIPHGYESWEDFWQNGVSPGEAFDKMEALPEFVYQLSTDVFPRGSRALVPGCGRGYAVEALANSGRYELAMGLDVAATAVDTAREYLSTRNIEGKYEMVQGDFFREDSGLGQFDLIYDYTFFCAIPVELRVKWAARMKELVRVGGVFVTVLYPMGKAREEGGPPHGVSVQDYAELLEGEGGFVAKDGPRKLSDEGCHESRKGRTFWAVWERVQDIPV